jgi:hypothetical protein
MIPIVVPIAVTGFLVGIVLWGMYSLFQDDKADRLHAELKTLRNTPERIIADELIKYPLPHMYYGHNWEKQHDDHAMRAAKYIIQALEHGGYRIT